jgi:GH43 family beta-xylosidase
MIRQILTVVVLCAGVVSQTLGAEPMLKTAEIRIRDPFIHADQATKTYYMYAAMDHGVGVYTSRDLAQWTSLRRVLTLPPEPPLQAVWAPEMHAYQGKYYLFATLTYRETLPIEKPLKRDGWPEMHIRGTHVFRADNPLGPFVPVKAGSHTPADWMALDGTLFVDGGKPYMVFCHEWVQMVDGTMDCVQLADDLSDVAGAPQLLFRASIAPGVKPDPKQSKVTDGCFLYRSERSGKLFMIWSTFIPGSGYCVVLAGSESGTIRGPWTEHTPIYTKDGGHGMLFKTFGGRLMLSLHQPNSGGKERLHLFEVTDTGDSLKVGKEVVPE